MEQQLLEKSVRLKFRAPRLRRGKRARSRSDSTVLKRKCNSKISICRSRRTNATVCSLAAPYSCRIERLRNNAIRFSVQTELECDRIEYNRIAHEESNRVARKSFEATARIVYVPVSVIRCLSANRTHRMSRGYDRVANFIEKQVAPGNNAL